MEDDNKKISDSKSNILKDEIHRKLVQSGEKDKLKELLRSRLQECGWRDELTLHTKTVIKRKGLENVNVDDLVTEITPKGRALVPDELKKELLNRIRRFLSEESNS